METTTNRWTKRTFLGVPLIGWALLAMAGTALAAVAFFVTLNATGTISLAQEGIDVQFTTVSTDNVATGNCTAEVTSVDSIAIDATNLGAGDYCEIAVEVVNVFESAQVDAAFQGFSMNNPTNVPGFQSNWDYGPGEIGNYCGTVIPADGTPTVVKVRLDVQWDSAPGASYDFSSLNGDGLSFVPAGTEQCG